MGLIKMWLKRRTAAATMGMIVAVLILTFTGCVSLKPEKESLPEDTLEAFEDAINAMDVNGMMDCLDAKTSKSITAGMDIAIGLLGAITEVDLGISAEDLIAAMPLFQEFIPADASDYPSVDFQITQTYISGNRATIYFYETGSQEGTIANMSKEDGVWKFSLDSRYIEESDADRVVIAGEEENQETDKESRADKEELKRALAEFFGF